MPANVVYLQVMKILDTPFQEAAMKKILFVCTGNTCRSPMAECMFRALAGGGWRIASAGIHALSGAPASAGARRAMQRRGLSLTAHRSQAVTSVLLSQMDLVIGMSESHIRQLRMMYPDCQTPMRAFDDPPISDPYGGDDAAYERAARDIERQLPSLLDL